MPRSDDSQFEPRKHSVDHPWTSQTRGRAVRSSWANGDEELDANEGNEHNADLPEWAQWAPSKVKLWLALGPILFSMFVLTPVMWASRVWLLAHMPWLLLVVSSRSVYLAATAATVPVVACFVIAIIRRAILVPSYYYLGYWGGDSALDYLAQSSAGTARTLGRIRKWFNKAGVLVTLVYQPPLVTVLAGASRMKFVVVLLCNIVNSIIMITVVRTLALQFPETLKKINHFVDHNMLKLTIVSIVVPFAIAFYKEVRNPTVTNTKKLRELEHDVEEGIEAEEQAHNRPHARAPYTSRPPRDRRDMGDTRNFRD